MSRNNILVKKNAVVSQTKRLIEIQSTHVWLKHSVSLWICWSCFFQMYIISDNSFFPRRRAPHSRFPSYPNSWLSSLWSIMMECCMAFLLICTMFSKIHKPNYSPRIISAHVSSKRNPLHSLVIFLRKIIYSSSLRPTVILPTIYIYQF